MCPAVGVEAESEKIQKLLSELAGKDVQEVIAEGKKSLAAMPAASAGAAAPAAGGAAPAAAAKKEEKKEEKPESDEVGAGHATRLHASMHGASRRLRMAVEDALQQLAQCRGHYRYVMEQSWSSPGCMMSKVPSYATLTHALPSPAA
jgi:ribosomal protein L12E/L44/L45/RPP1/RPP2